MEADAGFVESPPSSDGSATLHNAHVRDKALDALIAAIKVPGGFAEDLRGLAFVCTATWREEQVWDGLVRVQCGAARRTHLMYAAWTGDVARVRSLLTPRHARTGPAAQLALTDSNGRTALAWAAAGGDAETLRCLLEMGARVSVTALEAAIEGEHLELFGMLLAKAREAHVARIADPAYERRADIEIAKAWCPQREISAEMVELGVNARNGDGLSLLHIAALERNTAVAEALIRAGADVNVLDLRDSLLLADAATVGDTGIFAALLAAPGINVNARGGFASWTSLMESVECGRTKILRALLAVPDIDVNAIAGEYGAFRTALMLAAFYDHVPIINALLAVPGINVNLKDIFGYTALMLSAYNGHTEIVTALLAVTGIAVNEKNKLNQTALIKAASKGRTAVVAALLAVPGIDVNAKDKKRRSALSSAEYYGYADTAAALRAAGAKK